MKATDYKAGDRVAMKLPGTYRDQVLGMGHMGVVVSPLPTHGDQLWVLFLGYRDALRVADHEIDFIRRPEPTQSVCLTNVK